MARVTGKRMAQRARRADQSRALVQIAVVEKPRRRRLERRIGDPRVAVGEGEPLGLGDEMHAPERFDAHRRDVIRLEHLQDLQIRDAAG
jgi:hypothetical protein